MTSAIQLQLCRVEQRGKLLVRVSVDPRERRTRADKAQHRPLNDGAVPVEFVSKERVRTVYPKILDVQQAVHVHNLDIHIRPHLPVCQQCDITVVEESTVAAAIVSITGRNTYPNTARRNINTHNTSTNAAKYQAAAFSTVRILTYPSIQ